MFRFLAAPEITGEEVNNIAQTIKGMSLFDVLKIVVLVIVLVILVKLLTSLISRIITKSKIDKSAHSFLLSVVKGVLWFVAITILASSLGVDITSLIAVLSVAGLAVSLALQGALANLAGGLVILTTKPFKVGDYVDIGGNEGFDEDRLLGPPDLLCAQQHRHRLQRHELFRGRQAPGGHELLRGL